MSVAKSCLTFDGLIRFDFHFLTSKMSYKMNSPKGVHEFFENLKLHSKDFMYNPHDKLIVLYPTSEGKMVEIKSNDDIEFLMKTKICFNFETKEVYCCIELLIIVEKININGPSNQITILCQKFEQLSNQVINLKTSLNNKIEESAHNIQTKIRSVLPDRHPLKHSKKEHSFKRHINSKKAIQNDLLSIGQKPKLNVSVPSFESQQENTNEKLSTTLPNISKLTISDHATVIENQPKISVNKTYSRKDIKELVEMLKEQGFTNELRNIIILVRFDYNYEIALNHLKSNPIP